MQKVANLNIKKDTFELVHDLAELVLHEAHPYAKHYAQDENGDHRLTEQSQELYIKYLTRVQEILGV